MWRCAPWARAGHRHHVSRDRGAVRRWPASVTILLSSFLFVAVHSVQNQAGCVVWPVWPDFGIHVCQDGVKVEIVNSERQTGPPASGETARSGRERDFGRFSGRADYLRPHLRHAPWPCALWPQTLGLRNSTRVHCTWFGSAGARRAAVSVRNRATTTPTVCLCFPYVFPLIVFSSSCCCRRYRRVRTFCAEKSAPVSGVPESGVASSVRRAESSRAGRPRGGPVPGGESNGNVTVLGS